MLRKLPLPSSANPFPGCRSTRRPLPVLPSTLPQCHCPALAIKTHLPLRLRRATPLRPVVVDAVDDTPTPPLRTPTSATGFTGPVHFYTLPTIGAKRSQRLTQKPDLGFPLEYGRVLELCRQRLQQGYTPPSPAPAAATASGSLMLLQWSEPSCPPSAPPVSRPAAEPGQGARWRIGYLRHMCINLNNTNSFSVPIFSLHFQHLVQISNQYRNSSTIV
jgi:hypothetical protein